MSMSTDPAVRAAATGWGSVYEDEFTFAGPRSHQSHIATARAAFAPIRELHRKVATFVHVDGCDDDSADHERLWHFETADGEMVCQELPVPGWTCAECGEVASGADDLPEWPCDTALRCYAEGEL